MGLCTSMLWSNSKVKPSLEMQDISTYPILILADHSTPIFREQDLHPMSSRTFRRTAITSTGVVFRSMEDLLEEVNRQQTMLLQRR
uniref:C4 n=1 Tax=Tomato leaf curl Sulawesi virus TaxID=634441 RepID=C9WBG8_9GEMI|nr:C4 [Tomato leaf curl Sulawesi virus]